jgi:protein-L-isoaspartate(D-aspartate) O-methyltransferase
MGDVTLADELRMRGIRDEAVLESIGSLDRSLFMPESQRSRALYDGPLPIGHGQTISQPYIVAYMTEALSVEPEMKVLEIGTGSGYQGAVLAQMGADVYSVERIPELAATAKKAFEAARLHVHTKVGDGSLVWPEHAPYDRIIVTAAASRTPTTLIDQLARGGRMIAPVGQDPDHQDLVLIERSLDGSLTWKQLLAVRFVPLIEGTNAPSA